MRVKVYSQIINSTRAVNMVEGKEDVGTGTSSRVVPPLLPSQLAVCAPSPEVKLFVAPDQGKASLVNISSSSHHLVQCSDELGGNFEVD